MKLCKKCNQKKPYSEFNRHKLTKDGYFGSCKLCNYKMERARLATPEGKAVRDAYMKTREEQERVRKNAYRTSDKRKLQAQWAVHNAVKYGKLQKYPCLICGHEKVEAHHSSYDKEMFLTVVWLCKKHHTEVHKKYPELPSYDDGL